MASTTTKPIPDDFIRLLVERTNIVDLVGSYVKLDKKGSSFVGLCPFHEESTPSFSVNEAKSFYYCFGCHASGNVISFLRNSQNKTFFEAVQILAEALGLVIPQTEEISAQQTAINSTKKSIIKLLNKVSDYYHFNLLQNTQGKKALNYLQSRGLSKSTIKKFLLGFSLSSWKNVTLQFAQEKLLNQCGITVQDKQNNPRDIFNNRVIFPIRNSQGDTIAFGGRVFENNIQGAKYLNSYESIVFKKSYQLYGLYEACKIQQKWDEIIVVEGYMDVLMLSEHSIENVVATLGTATSVYHIERIYRITNKIIFCFDGDAAGVNAAKRALNISLPFLHLNQSAYFMFLPLGEDPDSLIKKISVNEFKKKLGQATSAGDFLFQSIGNPPSSIEEKAQFANLAMPVIERIPNGFYKDLIYKKFINLTGLSVENLKKTSSFKVTEKKQFASKQLSPTEQIIALILHNPLLAQAINVQKSYVLLEENVSSSTRLLKIVIATCAQSSTLSTGQLIAHFSQSHYIDKINAILSRDIIIESSFEMQNQQIKDYFNWLDTLHSKRRFQDLIRKPVNTLSNAEKQELKIIVDRQKNTCNK